MIKQIFSGFIGIALVVPLFVQAQNVDATLARVNRNESDISVISRSNQYRNTPDYRQDSQRAEANSQAQWLSQQPAKHHKSREGQHLMPAKLTQHQVTPNYAEKAQPDWALRNNQWQESQPAKTIVKAPK